MYSNSLDLGMVKQEKWLEQVWRYHQNDDGRLVKNGKHFVWCICPKCSAQHSVYMMWTGRGEPRKYCTICKPLVSGYDDIALYEASVDPLGPSKKKGRHHKNE